MLLSNSTQGLDEQMVSTIGREVLKGLEYMHSNGRIHRDIKACALSSIDGFQPEGVAYQHPHEYGNVQALSESKFCVQAANVLVGQDGRVVVGDFGTTATLERTERSHRFGQGPAVGQTASAWSHRQYLARNTFCGTPCFMAPEVMEQTQGCASIETCWACHIMQVTLSFIKKLTCLLA